MLAPDHRPKEAAVSATDQLLENAQSYAAGFDKGDLPLPPGRRVAIVACMDARLNPYALLGLSEGDAHIIRNAGGAVTPDVIRSLTISQRLLGTEEIVLIHHTGCGMLTFSDKAVLDQIEYEVGQRPDFALRSFAYLDQDVRESIAALRANPFLPHTDSIRGFVYDIETGALREVTR
jgi:carbonic anhydrase